MVSLFKFIHEYFFKTRSFNKKKPIVKNQSITYNFIHLKGFVKNSFKSTLKMYKNYKNAANKNIAEIGISTEE